jgi:hypothetical protein
VDASDHTQHVAALLGIPIDDVRALTHPAQGDDRRAILGARPETTITRVVTMHPRWNDTAYWRDICRAVAIESNRPWS